jgi:ABC-type sugar transport system ATPase subunit
MASVVVPMFRISEQPLGTVQVDGRDVTGVPVRERNVAMVYQQFINYPSLKRRSATLRRR